MGAPGASHLGTWETWNFNRLSPRIADIRCLVAAPHRRPVRLDLDRACQNGLSVRRINGELERVDYARYGSGLRLAEETMNVLGHDHVSGHHEAAAMMSPRGIASQPKLNGKPSRRTKSVVSRVPKCEAPGAPRFREKVNLNGTLMG